MLQSAYVIVQHHLDCDDGRKSRREAMCSLTDIWGSVCIHFSIAGNLEHDDQDGDHDAIRKRLELYHPPLALQKVINLQSNRTTPVITTVFKLDTGNILQMAQCMLFDSEYQQSHSLEVESFSEFQSVWQELLNTNIDPWDFPGSVHKLIFELYSTFAVWDNMGKYPFRNVDDPSLCMVDETAGGLSYLTLKEYHKAIRRWREHICCYFNILEADSELAQGIFRQPETTKFMVSSYLLCGNDDMRTRMDRIAQLLLNRREDDSVLDKALNNYNFPRLIRAIMENPTRFADGVMDIQPIIREVVEAVMECIQRVQEVTPKLLGVPKMDFEDTLRTHYFFAVKDHIISMISRIFGVIDCFGSIRLKLVSSGSKMQTVSEMLFQSPKLARRMQWMLQFILCSTEGIFGSPVTCFLGGNQYLAQNARRISDIATILGFLSNHWTKYIANAMTSYGDRDFVRSLFDWFPILEYPAIGIRWIECMKAITTNKEGGEHFKRFINENGKRDAMNRMMEEHLSVNKLAKSGKTAGCGPDMKYTHQHRKELVELQNIQNMNHDLTCFAFTGRVSKREKKGKVDKQGNKENTEKKKRKLRITDYYHSPRSESLSQSVTPGNDESMDNSMGNSIENDEAEDSDDSVMSLVQTLW